MNRNVAKALSFTSGMVVFTVIVGITIRNNDRLKAELEYQIGSFLKITRSLLTQYQGAVKKLKNISNAVGGNDAERADSIDKQIAKDKAYDQMWAQIERDSI